MPGGGSLKQGQESRLERDFYCVLMADLRNYCGHPDKKTALQQASGQAEGVRNTPAAMLCPGRPAEGQVVLLAAHVWKA